MSNTTLVKICYEGEIHRFRLDVDSYSYDEILELFRRTFSLKESAFVVQYTYADGDVVTIADDVEFRASLETFKDPHTKCYKTVRYMAADARELLHSAHRSTQEMPFDQMFMKTAEGIKAAAEGSNSVFSKEVGEEMKKEKLVLDAAEDVSIFSKDAVNALKSMQQTVGTAAYMPSPVPIYARAAVNTTTESAQEEVIVATEVAEVVETVPLSVDSDWEQVDQQLQKVHEEIFPAGFKVRTNTREYKVDEGDRVAHSTNDQVPLPTWLRTVARLPASLAILEKNVTSTVETTFISGFLRKKGEKDHSFKRRYMELNGTVLSYYKTTPEEHGGIPLSREDKKSCERSNIDLECVSSLQPMESESEPFGIHLATTARTWEIAAESEQDCHRWLKVLCNVVKFGAVHVTYKRMFQLQEVRLQAITDVRMVIATGDTVGEVVKHIFNCYKQALDATPLRPHDPTEYLLQITGSRDYLLDRSRVMNEYIHVRECLLAKKTVDLTVIHESVAIQETNRHAHPPHSQ